MSHQNSGALPSNAGSTTSGDVAVGSGGRTTALAWSMVTNKLMPVVVPASTTQAQAPDRLDDVGGHHVLAHGADLIVCCADGGLVEFDASHRHVRVGPGREVAVELRREQDRVVLAPAVQPIDAVPVRDAEARE